MQTQTQTDSAILEKTRELCETIVQQPEFQSIRRRVDAFMADDKAQSQYNDLTEKGRHLHEKQHQGLPLDGAEIAAFDNQRQAFLDNPVAKGFIDAQEEVHQIQQEVSQLLTKTFELGRVPLMEDLDSGSCGHGCGCHH